MQGVFDACNRFLHFLLLQFFGKLFVHNKQEASEIIADYALSRIPLAVRSSLTDEQLRAIRKAMVQQSSADHHRVAVRFTLPLFFKKYYFAFFFGVDRRRGTVDKEKSRIEGALKLVQSVFVFVGLSVFFFGLGLTVLTGLYFLKNALGVDLFSDFHLSDLVAYFFNVIDPIK